MAYEINITALPSHFQTAYASFTPTQQADWKSKRLRALKDGIYLGNDVLGFDFQENPHRVLFNKYLKKNPENKPSLYDLDLKVKKRMVLWPRGTYKTSSISVEVVQLILNYPDIRIAFLTGSDMLAKEQLRRIRGVFESPTPEFKLLFPEYCKENIGNSREFTVPCRKNTLVAQPTFKITTAKTTKASSHFDVIFVDDLVNETNYQSPKLLQKCINDYKAVFPLLEPGGYVYVTGTRYSFGDLYENIQELAKEEEKQFGNHTWTFSILTCWDEKCAVCGHGKVRHNQDLNYISPPCIDCVCLCYQPGGAKTVLFPEYRKKNGDRAGHTFEWLQRTKVEIGPEHFACQYENNPLASGINAFTPELTAQQTLFDLRNIPSAAIASTIIVGDLAYIGRKDRDFTVFYVVRCYMGQLFVVQCYAGNWTAEEICERLHIITECHRPQVIWLERFSGWEVFDTTFRMYAQVHGLKRFPVDWLELSNKSDAKVLRIGAIQPVLTARRLWLFGGMDHYDTLISQLSKWPRSGKHDDFADAMGYVCQAPTGYQSDSGVVIPVTKKEMEELYKKQVQKIISHKLYGTNETQEEFYDTRICGSY